MDGHNLLFTFIDGTLSSVCHFAHELRQCIFSSTAFLFSPFSCPKKFLSVSARVPSTKILFLFTLCGAVSTLNLL